MITSKTITKALMSRYESKNSNSNLNRSTFKELYKAAVKDYFPQLTEEYADQSIYGISFEIAGVVQKVYAEDFYTIVYFNTEEMYEESIEDCEEDEKDYYRFEPWAEWDVTSARTPLFEKLQDYLKENTLKAALDYSDHANDLSEEAVAWYEENESDFDASFEEECSNIRMWMAEVLGELRREGFWEEQENEDIYVIPFSGECDIDYEEMVETFKEIDQDYHGTEYLDYLEGQEN
ncbi:MAG: DUF4303 domain-containing protein [Ruminiclostridium sp.]|nr:DUF4303 domain-containing protein [Ruminiclostridium sp.]